MSNNRTVEKVILQVKLEELEKELVSAHHRIRELEMTVSDLGGCTCPKCLAGWGDKKKR